jgi:predicted negative regulator of RcsB-dependent stress response
MGAISLINDAIDRFPKVIYPKLTKFDICSKISDINGMSESISLLEKEIDSQSYFYKELIRVKCIFMAQSGKLEEALRLLDTRLKNYPEGYIKKLKQKLEMLSS